MSNVYLSISLVRLLDRCSHSCPLFFISLFLSLYLCLSLSLFPSLCLPLSVFISHSHSVFRFLAPSFCLNLSLFLSLSLFLVRSLQTSTSAAAAHDRGFGDWDKKLKVSVADPYPVFHRLRIQHRKNTI